MTPEQALALKPGQTVWATDFSAHRISDGFACTPVVVALVERDDDGDTAVGVQFPDRDFTSWRRHWRVHHTKADALRAIRREFEPIRLAVLGMDRRLTDEIVDVWAAEKEAELNKRDERDTRRAGGSEGEPS